MLTPGPASCHLLDAPPRRVGRKTGGVIFFGSYTYFMYRERLKAILTSAERTVFARLNSPQKVQDFLDTLSINFEMRGETNMSPRRVLETRTAHCFEGALLAAAAFAYHGQKPLLLDFQTIPSDEDHVVALFRHKGFWGAVSKTNHAILRYRDPVYKSIRELSMSYFHEYMMWNGKKSLRNFSRAFDLRRYDPEKWVIAREDLDWLTEDLDSSPHSPAVTKKMLPHLRKTSDVEIRAMKTVEWKPPKKFKQQ